MSEINVGKGIMTVSSDALPVFGTAPYAESTATQDLHWAVANQSCQQAQQDISAYACVVQTVHAWASTQQKNSLVIPTLAIDANVWMALMETRIS